MATTQLAGVLALQGDFKAHQDCLRSLGVDSVAIRNPDELSHVAGLVIPGGESSTLLKLMDPAFREQIIAFAAEGRAILATCAGIILLSKEVVNPKQQSLGLLNITVERNSYGRQLQSFIEPALSWTEHGLLEIRKSPIAYTGPTEGVFIRAPRITRIGENVSVLLECNSEPVLVKQDNLLGATFHPELSSAFSCVHALFQSAMTQRMCDNDRHDLPYRSVV